MRFAASKVRALVSNLIREELVLFIKSKPRIKIVWPEIGLFENPCDIISSIRTSGCFQLFQKST